MKTSDFSPKLTNGSALLTVMVFSAVGFMILGGAMKWTSTHAIQVERNNEYRVAEAAAEAACEKIMARARADYKAGGRALLDTNLASYANMVPTSAENSFWSNFEFSNALGNSNQTYVAKTAEFAFNSLIPPYEGLSGNRAIIRIISNVRQVNTRLKVSAAVQQDIWCSTIPIFQFAVFYQGNLEIHPASPMTIGGRVHCNGDIWSYTSAGLTYNGNVSATGRITHTRHPNDPNYTSTPSGSITYNGTKTTNVSSLTLPIGTNSSPAAVLEIIKRPAVGELVSSPIGLERYYNKAELLVLVTNNTFRWFPANVPLLGTTNALSALRRVTNSTTNLNHAIHIVVASQNPANPGTSNVLAIIGTTNLALFTNSLGTNYFFVSMPGTHYGTNYVIANGWSYCAVTNLESTLTVSGISPAYSTFGTNISNTIFGATCWLGLTNQFYDYREKKWVRPVQIDVDKLTMWSRSNTIVRSNIFAETTTNRMPVNLVYISDRRTHWTGYNSTNTLYAVRLVNGAVVGERGLTVATENPLYIKGNFNTTAAPTWSSTAIKPASVVADALTVLSSTWNDTWSPSTSLSSRSVSSDITINAAIMAGNVPTTNFSSYYSGGLHNNTRYLESWGSSRTANYRGSFVCLYYSDKATNKFVNIGLSSSYYAQPTRNLVFDTNYTNMALLPPGTPSARVMVVDKWTPAPPGQTNYVQTYAY